MRSATADAAALVAIMRAQIRSIDPDSAAARRLSLTSLEEHYAEDLHAPRFQFALFGAMSGFGLVLTLAGIYGVLSHHVSQRTREIGVRMALGAGSGQLVRFVVGRGARPVALGLAMGAGVSLGLARVIEAQVLQLRLTDPLAILAAVTLLSLAALAACWGPARRAMRVDPIVALRAD